MSAPHTSRLGFIDTMRGLSIIAMMALHVLAYYKNDPVAFALWSIFQFSVPGFIFCSAYLFYQKESASSFKHGLSYYKKRIIRLLIPFYVFVLCYATLLFAFEPSKLTLRYIANSLLLIDGVYINWLPLLFIYLSLLMPILLYLKREWKVLYFVWIGVGIAAAIIYLDFAWPAWWRIGMVATWSLLLPFTWYLVDLKAKQKTTKWVFLIALLATAAFGSWQHNAGHSLEVTHNKYPPNALYLSFSAGSMVLLWRLSRLKVFEHSALKRTIDTFSKYSYELFYIHFFVIFLLLYTIPTSRIHWSLYVAIMFGVSALALTIQQSVAKRLIARLVRKK